MKTFSRLSLLTLLFLGIALMLVGGTTDVYALETSLQVTGDTGKDKEYDVGDRVETVFTATDADGEAVEGADLTINHVGLTDVTISDDGTTNKEGEVIVRGADKHPPLLTLPRSGMIKPKRPGQILRVLRMHRGLS